MFSCTIFCIVILIWPLVHCKYILFQSDWDVLFSEVGFWGRLKCKYNLGCWQEFADTSLCPSWPFAERGFAIFSPVSCAKTTVISLGRDRYFPQRICICKLVKARNKYTGTECKYIFFLVQKNAQFIYIYVTKFTKCWVIFVSLWLVWLSVCAVCESSPWHFQCTHFRSTPLAMCLFSTMHCGIHLLNPGVKIEYTFPAAITSAISSQRRPVTHPNYSSLPKADQSLPEAC